MIKYLVVLFLFIQFITNAQIIDSTKYPAQSYIDKYVVIDSTENQDLSTAVIGKIMFDFNNDGIKDIALTDYSEWGAHIGSWDIYLGQINGFYRCIGSVEFVSDAVRVTPVKKGVSKITSYSRYGGDEGQLLEYFISFSGVKQGNEITIHPDYPGTHDYDLYMKLFRGYELPDSCIQIIDYLKTKKISWQKSCKRF